VTLENYKCACCRTILISAKSHYQQYSTVSCVPKLGYFYCLWFLRTDYNNFFTIAIRNNQRQVRNKICHLALNAFPHYLTKIVQYLSTFHTRNKPFLPARRSKRGICYGNEAGWMAGWLARWMSV